jgi:hypothetical protein
MDSQAPPWGGQCRPCGGGPSAVGTSPAGREVKAATKNLERLRLEQVSMVKSWILRVVATRGASSHWAQVTTAGITGPGQEWRQPIGHQCRPDIAPECHCRREDRRAYSLCSPAGACASQGTAGMTRHRNPTKEVCRRGSLRPRPEAQAESLSLLCWD